MQANKVAGGRTAWSATVTINGFNIGARYWYDGQYIYNAKEDASEVALGIIRNPALWEAQQRTRTQAPHGSGGWAR